MLGFFMGALMAALVISLADQYIWQLM